MKRTTFNLLIDSLAAALFVGMIATGYILYFAMPPGTNKSLVLWGLSRHQWGQVHFWISLGLLAILLVHVTLHWQWIVAMVAQRFGLARGPQARHIRSGVIALVVVLAVLGIFGWVTEVSVREREIPWCPPEAAPKGAGGPTSVEAGHPSAGARVDFWTDVYPIFESKCLRCHGASKPRGGFRVDRREDYFGKAGQPPLIIAGRSDQSPLIAIVRGLRPDMAMASSHKLPAQDVAVLRAWIDAGAEWPEKPGGN